ncbi:hypothetical protein CSUB01_11412 [Colletotrichum sublineola]|uniref:PD-(D/E)XK nuclease-like domain-containing protein n=1 Tax=Colletotrichum sublineola TaxID=1173701 RepID=A0A066Y230_COLSU|nr:hypothetical protein CSUB01_11412 [Colletotrichum sublineola]
MLREAPSATSSFLLSVPFLLPPRPRLIRIERAADQATVPSPSSQILERFKPLSAPSMMIDYCFIVRPDFDTPDYSGPVDAILDRRAGRSANHTGLDRSPIALSIETKRSREEWDEATLQLGTGVALGAVEEP